MYGILKRDKLLGSGRGQEGGGRKRILSFENRVYLLMAAAKEGFRERIDHIIILIRKGEVFFLMGRGCRYAEVRTFWT